MLKVTVISFGRVIASTEVANIKEATAWIKEHHYDGLEADKRCGVYIEQIKNRVYKL